jgi:hypothetical protein
MNAWADANQDPSFRFASGWHNTKPGPNEKKSYDCELESRPAPTGWTDYGIIFMQPLPNGNRALLLAAASSYGTLGLGEFFCNPEKMRPLYETLRARTRNRVVPPSYEILIKVRIKDNLPIETAVVACR